MAGNARQYHTQQTHFLRAAFAYNTASGVSLKVGTLPAGARVLRTTIDVETAFNAGTTNTINVGYAANGTDLSNAGAGGAQAVLTPAVSIAAAQIAADTDVFVQYNQTGGAATAGAGTVIIEYAPNI